MHCGGDSGTMDAWVVLQLHVSPLQVMHHQLAQHSSEIASSLGKQWKALKEAREAPQQKYAGNIQTATGSPKERQPVNFLSSALSAVGLTGLEASRLTNEPHSAGGGEGLTARLRQSFADKSTAASSLLGQLHSRLSATVVGIHLHPEAEHLSGTPTHSPSDSQSVSLT